MEEIDLASLARHVLEEIDHVAGAASRGADAAEHVASFVAQAAGLVSEQAEETLDNDELVGQVVTEDLVHGREQSFRAAFRRGRHDDSLFQPDGYNKPSLECAPG